MTSSSNPPVTGIRSFGAFVPRRRLSRAAIAQANAWAFPSLKGLGKGERSMCSWDEDAITMAVEAGRDCLRGTDRDGVAGITLASTTAPYTDLNNAALVAGALRLPAATRAGDVSGSSRIGLSAVIDQCLGAAGGDRLVIASERRTAKPGSAQELTIGSGAAAVRIGSGGDLIARFVGSEAITVPFIDHFRKAGEEFDYGWEERWIRDEGISKLVPKTVTVLLKRANVGADKVAFFGMAGGPGGTDKIVAKMLGIAPEKVLPDLQGTVGDTGSAHGVLLLVSALERAKAGDFIVVASFAQGCEVALFEMLDPSPVSGRRGLAGSIAARIEETAYTKLLSFDGHLDLDWGMRSETDNKTALTQLYRVADQVLGFVGGKCSACGATQFPRMPSCVQCGATDSQSPFPLVDEPAKVATYTADWLMYTPAPPLYVGLVQFDVGARALMEIVDVGAKGLEVGTPLNMTFRIKERDKMRHFDRYFWKATPAN